jgi:hypothetical protein
VLRQPENSARRPINFASQEKKVEKRKFKRYTYKPDCCPFLDCQGIKFKVLNISEGGLKIEIQSNPDSPTDSYAFNGYLCFSSGEKIQVSGKQVWIIGNEIGVKLNAQINEKIIDSEFENFQDT